METPARPPDPEELLAHRGWVRRLCRHLTADAVEADEVEQEAWRRALESPPRHGGNPRSWLSSVVRSAVWHRRRGESRRTAAHRRMEARAEGAHDADEATARGPGASADRLAERRESFELLNRLLAELEEPYGEVVYLRYVEDLRPRAIAQRLGVPVATVKTRLHRGLAILRRRAHARWGEAWRARLLVFATAPSAAAGATVLTILTMTKSTKLLIGAAAVLLAVPLIPLLGPANSDSPADAREQAPAPLVASDAPPAPAAPVSQGRRAEDTRPAASSADFLADRAPSLFVQVVDARTLEPVADAEVVVLDRGRIGIDPVELYLQSVEEGWDVEARVRHYGQAYRTDPDGRLAVATTPDGALEIVAAHEGLYAQVSTEAATPAEPEHIVLRLQPSRHLRVRVLDHRGRPAAGVQVEYAAVPPGVPPFRLFDALTDADGRATLRNLQERDPFSRATMVTAEVWARVATRAHLSQAVDPHALPAEPVVLRLPPTVPLLVRAPEEQRHLYPDRHRFNVVRVADDPPDGQDRFVGEEPPGAHVIRAADFSRGEGRLERIEPGFDGYLVTNLPTAGGAKLWQRLVVPEDASGEQSVEFAWPEHLARLAVDLVDEAGEPRHGLRWTCIVRSRDAPEELRVNLHRERKQPARLELIESAARVAASPHERWYTFCAYAPGDPGTLHTAVFDLDAARRADDGPTAFVVPDRIVLQGRVVDSAGNPARGARVALSVTPDGAPAGSWQRDAIAVEVDDAGRFAFFGRCGALREVTVFFRGDSWRHFDLEAGSVGVVLEVEALTEIHGQLLVDPEIPAHHVALSIERVDEVDRPAHTRRFQIQDNGSADLRAVPTGVVRIVAHTRRGELLFRSDPIELRPDAVTRPACLDPLDLRGKLHRHELHVRAPDGRAVLDYWLRDLDSASTWNVRGGEPIVTVAPRLRAVVDADGFHVSDPVVVAGEARVRLQAPLRLVLRLPEGVELDPRFGWAVLGESLAPDAIGEPLRRAAVLASVTELELPRAGSWRLVLAPAGINRPEISWRHNLQLFEPGEAYPHPALDGDGSLTVDVAPGASAVEVTLPVTQEELDLDRRR